MNKLKSVLLSSVIFSCISTAFADPVILRYSAWLPSTYFMHERALYKYFDDIARVTEDRVKVEISAAPLGPAPRNFQLAYDGIADITWGLHGYTPGTFPLSELVELPFYSTNAEADSVAYWRVFEKYLEPAGMHDGVHTLAVHTQPPGEIFMSSKSIKSPDDFYGIKIRSTNSGVADSLSLLDALPLGIPVTDMRDALHKGIVDGVTLTGEAIYNFNINSLVNYALEIPGGFYNASMFVVMNQDKWNKISAEDQKAITEISGEALARRMGRVWQEEQDQAGRRLKDDGIETTQASGPLLEFIQARLSRQEERWLEKANSAGLDANGVLNMYRAESAREQ